jgi:hypothetical protein
MDKQSFEAEVRERIKDLSRDAAVFFAWLCAVRALPFLGNKGNFNFGEDSVCELRLHSVFLALDCSAAHALHIAVNSFPASHAADAFSHKPANSAVFAASFAALDSIYYAAHATGADADIGYIAARAARITVDAAVAANAAAVTLQEIMLQDIEIIKNDRDYAAFNNDLSLYDNVWGNFQQALRDIDCGYWGDLYANIFANNFRIDEEALERRLSVPKEIREQGANTIAKYIFKMERGGSKRLDEARIIILGEEGAGKTCLSRYLADPNNAEMTTKDERTDGVDIFLWGSDAEAGE